eukprot:TRINITY_DN6701_c0_g1_i1.p1 TRINITY_DN6701_c0_g1~~TRINITY_DN6701_c0_g1_i1.p1  ORF type:complete len:445 (-),score=67.20 TRINITY_DN6701_c0_g1_i1:98-1381(-)
MAAHDSVGAKFKMATNGWVVGPLPDRSIFDKVLPTSWDAITSIDLNTGHNPVDPSYLNVTRHNKWAIPWMEDDPDLTAPQLWVNRTLIHMENAQRYGCNGLLGIHWRTRAVSPAISAMAQKSWNSSLKSQTFWLDWVSAQFGLDGSNRAAVAAVFDSVDSFHMPTVVSWSGGPGRMNPRDCSKLPNFSFINTLESLGVNISGAVNKDRFSYGCLVSSICPLLQILSVHGMNSTKQWQLLRPHLVLNKSILQKLYALPARILLVSNASVLIGWLQQTLSTPGELGTYMNIESHSFISMLTQPGQQLETYLQTSLPPQAQPPSTYSQIHLVRLIVPVVRNTLSREESFDVRILVLSPSPCTSVNVFTRSLGSTKPFKSTSLKKLVTDRDVFENKLDNPNTDFEWYAKASCGSAQAVFPVGAPPVTQTVC